MKISQLYVYPIKSLRGTAVTEWEISKTGLQYDRKFMLLQVMDDDAKPPKLKNMHVAEYSQMTLYDMEMIAKEDPARAEIKVTYVPPRGDARAGGSITIPLLPDVAGLPKLDVNMHQSPTVAYNMGSTYNTWFSSCFGFDVVLAYIDKNIRPILGTFSPSSTDTLKRGSSMFSRLNPLPRLGLSWALEAKEEGLTFADCASFLVVTEASLKDASARLPGDEEMDVTKFRPNLVLSGAKEAWEEDFWGEIAIGPDCQAPDVAPVHIALTKNCVRCRSINIDYATGRPGTGEAGSMLKKLMKDRRVDKGVKYSPVFGRYGYLSQGVGSKIGVGDEVSVVKQLQERTTFDWPGVGGN
ncbi:MAG: hypothetical protein M1818_001059 [Claussenomyces sp. TS43310]|nr:MAG: hypothetical protein M1818_001059 [Claussenomyces sp. TS43310]